MKMSLKVGTALALLMAAAPMAAFADSTATTGTTSPTAIQIAEVEVDAGKLIGQDVVDANGDTIGEIDSVMVDAKGKVRGVVIDVSSWLESEKLISMPWKDLQISNDNKVVATNLTKDSATAATTYAYVDPANKGKVFTDETDTANTDTANTDTTNATATTTAEVDAGKLIGQNVVDANGDTVGEIDSVMVDAKGKVQGVVIDVSSWLQSEKLISMPWKDLQISNDNKVVATTLTKDSATAATTYAYVDPANKGKVFTDDTATTDAAATTTAEVDAGKLIGQDVVDANGDTVGEIDSVMVDAKGKVRGVVMDVSSWLESEKLISMPWKDLQISNDNKVVATNLTKDSATAATTYAYVDPANKGKVFTDETYTDTATGTGTGMALGTPVKNSDGSINVSQLMGLKVENPDGHNVGEIGEVILDNSGKVEGVVVDVGGFLGIGEHPVLLNWKDVKLAGNGNDVKANVAATVESLKAMPVYERAD